MQPGDAAGGCSRDAEGRHSKRKEPHGLSTAWLMENLNQVARWAKSAAASAQQHRCGKGSEDCAARLRYDRGVDDLETIQRPAAEVFRVPIPCTADPDVCGRSGP